MLEKSRSLDVELEELFDIRFAKTRDEKTLNQAALEAQRDIRVITHMFRDGIPDVEIAINSVEILKWDSGQKRLFLRKEDEVLSLEAASRETVVRIRPFLSSLVKQAKEFYRN
jgi:ERCC4-type nuclease